MHTGCCPVTQPPLTRRRGALRAPPQTAPDSERSAAAVTVTVPHGEQPGVEPAAHPAWGPVGPLPTGCVLLPAAAGTGPLPALQTQPSHLWLLSDPHGTGFNGSDRDAAGPACQ